MSVEPLRKKSVVPYRAQGSSHGARIVALEHKVLEMASAIDVVKGDVKAAALNTQEILDLMTHTKSVFGFCKKHAPRVFAFGLGALLYSGRISPVMHDLLTKLFGV